MHGPTELTRLGATIDDAVGEAFDKAANILEAGYPGGPAIDRLARRGQAANVEPLPRSMLEPDSLDFSFSGLKTALLYRVRGKPIGRGRHARFERSAADLSEQHRADLAAAFEEAAVEAVIAKLERALDRLAADGTPAGRLVIGGGVSANSRLRQRAMQLGEARGLPVHIPALRFCVDNAAMIAGLAHHALRAGQTDSLDLPAIATTSL
jgi:N6-L-threonylcarbamoyladenine synthase